MNDTMSCVRDRLVTEDTYDVILPMLSYLGCNLVAVAFHQQRQQRSDSESSCPELLRKCPQ
jgi:hypothetical protein